MGLVGREHELGIAAAAVAQACEGTPRALALTGEAGIGKTALTDALAARCAAAGMLVLRGRAAEHEREVPFALVIDALDDHVAAMGARRVESLGPDLAAVLPSAAATDGPVVHPEQAGASERFRYHRALHALLELLGREQPVALVLDDAHWADDASLEFLLHILRRPPSGPVLVGLAARPAEPTERLLDCGRSAQGFEHVPVGPLSDAAVRELLADENDPAVREHVAREAGGNPLFVKELARAASRSMATLPPNLMAAIRLELGALPPASRALVDGAAVAGEPFDPELASLVADISPDSALVPLDRLIAAGLIRPTGEGPTFAFRHPLVRRAVYEAVPPGWRLAAHERAAAALAARGAGVDRRAHHVAQSARPGDDAAIAVLTEAAEAAATSSPTTSARWYAAALRLLPENDVPRRASLLWPMAFALAGAGRLDEAHAALEQALALLPDEPMPERLALVAILGGLELALGRHPDAMRRLLAAYETAPGSARAGLALELAVAAIYGEDRDATLAWSERALEAAGDHDHLVATAAGGINALTRQWLGEPEATHAALDAALERYRRIPDAAVGGRLEASVYLGMALMMAERFADADEVASRGLAAAGASFQGHLFSLLGLLHAWIALHRMELATALDEVERGEERARLQDMAFPVYWAHGTGAIVRDTAGDRRAADESAAVATALEGRFPDSHFARIVRFNLAALRSEVEPLQGIADMREAAGEDLTQLDPSWQSWGLLMLTRACIAAGRIDEAETAARQATDRAAAMGLPVGLARGATAGAEVLLARGDAAAAATLARQAAADAAAAGAPRDECDALVVLGRALGEAGDRDGAVAVLQDVAARAGAGGAFKLRDAAARELRRLGARITSGARRAAGATGVDGLTERERDIAELVSNGHTNKQVAAALFLSEKTIEHHLSNIYAKLGVRSRTALPAALART